MKIHLHIGTHKTGTTAIQYFCLANRDLLARHGVYWPEEKLPPSPHQYSRLAQELEAGNHGFVADFLERTIRAAETEGTDSLLLSGEAFCHLTSEKVSLLVDMLAGHELEVIVYFRNIYDYAASAFAQSLKHEKNPKPLPEMLGAIRSSLDYSAILTAWERHVAPEHIQVRSYEAERGDIVGGFLRGLGIPAEAIGRDSLKRPRERNESLDMATQLLLAACGYARKPAEFQEARDLYAPIFAGMTFQPRATQEIATALCSEDAADLSHPRLAPFRTELAAAPSAQKEQSAEDVYDYLTRLSRYSAELARLRRRRMGLLARFRGWHQSKKERLGA